MADRLPCQAQSGAERVPRPFWIPILVALALSLPACSGPESPSSLSLGAPKSLLASLIWLTEDLGFFSEQDIRLQIHGYPSGKRALAAMLAGREQLAATAETPFVIASFGDPDLRLYATTGQSDNEVRILARRDHGIDTPADLVGKTVATQKGSAVHFFLSSFLLFQHIAPDGVNIEFMKAEQLPLALARGEIDAISMREPFLSQARKAIGAERVIEFSVPGLYTKTYNLVGSSRFVTQWPGVMEKLLAALDKGAEYANRHPGEAIRIIARKLQLPIERLAEEWPDLHLAVALNQTLLTTLQEEARWALSSGLVGDPGTTGNRIPDFLTRLDPQPLARAVPGAVGLIGIEPK